MSDLATRIEPHVPALRRYAWALLRDQDSADDLVQDCLEKAVGGWHLHRNSNDTKAWLFTILRNLYLNDLRRQRRRGQHVELTADASHEAPDPDGERNLMTRDALQALSRLPEDQRSLLLLIGVEDFSYQQAAALFGVPTGTIMSRLSRARESLRAAIEAGPRMTLRRVK